MKIKSTGAPVDTTVPPYLLDNAGREAPARFGALSAMFDTGTIRHLEERGVARGWQCWEVGGGGGSIATWLARRVGLAGRVLATDIDPRFLETLKVPNLEVRRHDIVSDPLPEETFDLIHARLVLVHLPQWQKVDRKSTRLNSSHGYIPYAVFCLEKNQVVSVRADIAFDADPKLFACLVRFESSSVPTTLPTAYDVYPLDGRHDGGYYTVKDCVTIDVLPRTPGNNVYVGFMVWSNFTATKCRGLVSLNQVIKEIICLQPLK